MVIEADPRNPAPGAAARVQVHYKHRREEDCYFELPPQLRDTLPGCVRALMRPRHTPKVRVTYEQRSRKVVATIVKVRVADLNIHMPNSPLDCRISINLEMNWPGPVEELEQIGGGGDRGSPPRQKDRLSYAQGSIQVDLTQVTTPMSGHNVSCLFFIPPLFPSPLPLIHLIFNPFFFPERSHTPSWLCLRFVEDLAL